MRILSEQKLRNVIKGCENDSYLEIVAAARILMGIIDGSKNSKEEDIKTTLWVKFMQADTRVIQNNPDKAEIITWDCRMSFQKPENYVKLWEK